MINKYINKFYGAIPSNRYNLIIIIIIILDLKENTRKNLFFKHIEAENLSTELTFVLLKNA